MKIYFIFCFISIFLLVSCETEKSKEKQTIDVTPQVNKISKGDSIESGNCTYLNKYNLVKRLSFYPFNKAMKVKLIAFTHKNTDEHIGAGRLVENEKVAYSRIDEIKTLTPTQIDSLTDIIYNIGFIPTEIPTIAGARCYIPRNGILFIDENYQVFEWIEICFQCMQHTSSNKEINLEEMCRQKYKLLQSFFRKSGIEYVEDEN